MARQRWMIVQELLDEEIPPHWDINTEQLSQDIVDALDEEA